MAAAVRNIATSPTRRVAMYTAGRRRRVTPTNTRQTNAAAAMMTTVVPSVLRIRLQRFSVGVRCAANQRGMVRSPRSLPLPSLTTSSPSPTIRPRNSTHATSSRAATRDRQPGGPPQPDRKSTRLNSSHVASSYAVFCLNKKHSAQQRKAMCAIYAFMRYCDDFSHEPGAYRAAIDRWKGELEEALEFRFSYHSM